MANKLNVKLRGKGSYGYVNRVIDRNKKFTYAEKHLYLDDTTSKEKKRFIKEFNIMKKYTHENLVKAYSIDKTNYIYTMEYCDSTLFYYVRANNNKLKMEQRISMAKQFLNGINFLHKNNILHRDLSFNNVLVKKKDGTVTIKIADFGLAKDLNDSITCTKTNNNRGTIIDPLLENFNKYSIQNEMYSIGYILYYIFRGRTKVNLDNEDNSDIKNIIKKCTNINSIKSRYNCVKDLLDDINNIKY